MTPISEENRAKLTKALQEISADYYKAVIEIASYFPELDELNYIRTPIHMPNGSEYLLALLHVSGPVLSLEKLRKGEYFEGSIELAKITAKEVKDE